MIEEFDPKRPFSAATNTSGAFLQLGQGAVQSVQPVFHTTTFAQCSECMAVVAWVEQHRHLAWHSRWGQPVGTFSPVRVGGEGLPLELQKLVQQVLEHMRTCDEVADDFMAAGD